MLSSKAHAFYSMHLYKNNVLMQLPKNSLTSLNRNFSANNNHGKRTHHLGNWIARLARFFDRNLKRDTFAKFTRRTTNLFFCSILENKLVQSVLNDFARSMTRKRDMLLSATAVSVYNWEKNSVPDHHIEEHVHDVDYIEKLTLETITCRACNLRLWFDQKLPTVKYCTCSDSKAPHPDIDGWKPFLERQNTLVWRKEHECYKGLYAYKMYGKLDQVNMLDFIRVQLDTQFRKQWDSTANELRIIEEREDTNTDLVYWETQWPRPFANRDYVFQRKLTFVPNKKTCIISSVATSHPAIPVNKSLHRVTEYWSFMVVKPMTDLNEPGTEFVLTYFDNPGLSIPSSVSTWVAMTGLPNFVSKLQDAAAKVSELSGPEPALMRCLREWTGTWHENVLTAEEERISGFVPLDNGETVTIEESTLTVTVKEPAVELPVDERSPPAQTEDDPSPEASSSGEDDKADDDDDKSDAKLPIPVPANSTGGSPVVVVPCSDATQFLPGPVFA